MKTMNKTILKGLLLGATVMLTPQASASEGYFQYAWGARHSGLAGAGIADVTDATGQIINPAGLASVEGSELSLGMTLFSPIRKFTGGGDRTYPGLLPGGETKSGRNYFLIPTIAYSKRIDDTSAWGITMYGNGGMNTSYPDVARGPECQGGSGIFCGGEAGVDLMQGFLAPTYAKSFGKVSVGVSPLIAFQLFEAKGLGLFGQMGFSNDAANLTNNGHDLSLGLGVKLSTQIDLTDGFRIAASYQPKISMGKFDKYAGLFADGGSFDIPENYTLGIAMDLSENLTFMADYKHISYSGINAISNPTMAFGDNGQPLPFGADGGPGFGWDDVNVYKFGLEWNASDAVTLRAGFSTNTNPIGPEDVTLNILAPGVVQDRYTMGASYALSDSSSLEFAVGYVPSVSASRGASDPYVSIPAQPSPYVPGTYIPIDNPMHTADVEMHQTVITVSWTKHF